MRGRVGRFRVLLPLPILDERRNAPPRIQELFELVKGKPLRGGRPQAGREPHFFLFSFFLFFFPFFPFSLFPLFSLFPFFHFFQHCTSRMSKLLCACSDCRSWNKGNVVFFDSVPIGELDAEGVEWKWTSPFSQRGVLGGEAVGMRYSWGWEYRVQPNPESGEYRLVHPFFLAIMTLATRAARTFSNPG